MIKFIKKLLGLAVDDEIHEHKSIINLIDYHYNVESIYNDVVLVNLDVDSCDIERGQIVKLLNKLYVVQFVEFIPSNSKFRYSLCLTDYDNE